MTTKYQLLIAEIQDKILSGRWYSGMLMPTEHELCDMYSVSRITVRRALDELEREGMVKRIQGKGSFVNTGRLRSGEGKKGFMENMTDRGSKVTSLLLKEELTVPTQEVLIKLRLAEQQKVWHFTRLRFVDERPVVIMDTYISEELGNKMRDFNLASTSFYQLYEKITGHAVTETESTVTAINPGAETCELLQVPAGSAHIWYKSVGYLDDGKPVDATYAVFNANLYEFSVNMSNARIK